MKLFRSVKRAVRGFRPLLAAISMLCLSACSTVPEDQGVEVNVVNLAIGEASLLETAAIFSVRIQNENAEPLVVEGAVHKIYLDGAYIGKGMSNETLTVDRLSTAVQKSTVYLRNLKLAGRLRSIMESQRVDYRIESVLHVARNGGARRIRVSNEGRFAPGAATASRSLRLD